MKVGEFQIFEESGGTLSIGAPSSGVGDERVWFLKCGSSYTLSLAGEGSCKGDACFPESTAIGDSIPDRGQSPDFTDD